MPAVQLPIRIRRSAPLHRAALALALLFAAAAQAEPDAEAARALHERLLVLDSHVDTPLRMLEPGFDFTARHDRQADVSQVDLPRAIEGGADALFMAAFVSQDERSPEGYAAARATATQMLRSVHELARHHPDRLAIATRAAEVPAIVTGGRRALLLAIENGYALGADPAAVQAFHDLGVRYLTLTHFTNNALGDSSTDPSGPEHGGLSDTGRAVVRAMNRSGMMVDVSHAADSTFWDVLAVSESPVIASHSGAHAVFAHPRNLRDEMIIALAHGGGVVQVNGFSTYLAAFDPDPAQQAAFGALRGEHAGWMYRGAEARRAFFTSLRRLVQQHPPPRAPLSALADHIDHVVQLVGIEHVGVSMDFDGGGGVAGLDEISALPALTAELLRRGYGERDLAALWGGNLLRVMARNETLAAP